MKTPVFPPVTDDTGSASARPKFPVHRAFVIHLVDDAEPALNSLAGRVEHVVTGRTARFDDVATLVAFFREALTPRDEGA